tara:strand:+ start:238 stop:813 length:576 start_codon:yes stop_codon:yes gene_type:complete
MKKFLILLISPVVTGESLFAAEAGMPQLDPKYWASQSFWLIIIFLSIYLLIARIFIPKIKNSIDMRESKIRKDLEEAKVFREEAEKKLKSYKELMETAKIDARKILYESNRSLNEEMQEKKNKIQKEIEKEIYNAENEIIKFKNESLEKVNFISEEIVSSLIKEIFGEDLNRSSIKATVSETIKEQRIKKI